MDASIKLRSALAEQLGLTPDWAEAFMETPRHLFLPSVFWSESGDNRHARLDQRGDEQAWLQAAYQDSYAVFQWDEGHQEEPDERFLATSSASRPAVVMRQAADLELDDDSDVLELGTGSGWFSCVLRTYLRKRARHGKGRVVTVEMDPEMFHHAMTRIRRTGTSVEYEIGDGEMGWPGEAPYDRLVATYSVDRISDQWREQITPGGIILAPWTTPWASYGTAKLRVEADGSAHGRFLAYGAFLRSREAARRLGGRFGPPDLDGWNSRVTTVNIWDLLADNDAGFAVGNLLPDVQYLRDATPVDETAKERVWLFTRDLRSLAAVERNGDDQAEFTVRATGTRDLIGEVADVYQWFIDEGRPAPDRYGLSVQPGGEHVLWLDHPDHVLVRR
ncbi:methyltransferase domain-containing protein [Streptacidiphilus fuscans]|nr:methyltransferase domain-containing protein [Streptacidiphilus fuscans]